MTPLIATVSPPTGWTMRPLRYVAAIDPGKSQVAHLPDDLEVSFLPMEDVGIGGVLEPTESRRLGEVRDGYTYLRDGDVTFAKISPSFQNHKGGRAEGLVNGLGFATSELTVLRPRPDVDGRYLQYVISSDLFVGAGCATLHGVAGQQRVDSRFVRGFKVPLPSLEVQRRVADMLDAETVRIDTLIAKNYTVLSSLAQRIVSLRAELLWPTEARRAWTGSPLDAPTSAVPSATKVQYVVPVRVAGGTPATGIDAYWSEDPGDLPWFGVGDFAHGRATEEPSRRVTDSGVDAAGLKVMQRGDLLLAMYGATSGKAGVLSEPGTTNQAVMAMRSDPRVLQQDYLIEWFNFARPYAYEKAESRSSTQPNLNAGQIEKFSIRCPSLPEQDAATKALDHARGAADALQRRVERQIDLLRTRRRALITAAVTGQITI